MRLWSEVNVKANVSNSTLPTQQQEPLPDQPSFYLAGKKSEQEDGITRKGGGHNFFMTPIATNSMRCYTKLSHKPLPSLLQKGNLRSIKTQFLNLKHKKKSCRLSIFRYKRKGGGDNAMDLLNQIK